MFNLFKKAPANPYVKQDDAQTYRVRVRTRPHGEVVEFRFTKGAHIGIDDDGTYLFRKPVVTARDAPSSHVDEVTFRVPQSTAVYWTRAVS